MTSAKVTAHVNKQQASTVGWKKNVARVYLPSYVRRITKCVLLSQYLGYFNLRNQIYEVMSSNIPGSNQIAEITAIDSFLW